MLFKPGDTFTQKFNLSSEVYEGFIKLFSDRNPLHIQKAFAHRKGFKDVVMHGNILNGFLSYFVGECLPEKNVIIHSQEIQFKNPVYLHDELLFNAEITGIFESVGAVEFNYTFRKSDQKIVAKGKFQIGILQ